MTKKTIIASAVGLALCASLAACAGEADDAAGDGAVAEETASEEISVIDERQANFESIGDAFMAIREQMESGEPDFEAVSASAATIDAAAQLVSGYFPEGTGMDSGAETEALATIWEQPEEFSAAAEQLTTASAGLVEAAATADAGAVGAASMELGGACMNCHETFRLDDES